MGMVFIQPLIVVSKLKNIKTEFLRCTGYLNSIKPYKARFIANSSSCTTTELSKVLTSCLTTVKIMLSSTVKRYMRDLVKTYFGEILDNLKLEISMGPVLSTYDFLLFTTLYTTLPHN